jgi:predicted kinase
MSLKDAYHQKMEAQLEEQQARLNLLKAKAKRAVAEGRILAYEELGEADAKMSAAKEHLKKLAHSSEAAFKEMKTGMEAAWQDLKVAGQNAAKHYKDSPAEAESPGTTGPIGNPTASASPPPAT